jgi:hypothetical protein
MKPYMKFAAAAFAALFTLTSVVSCNLDDDDDNWSGWPWPNALATIKTDSDGTVFFQVDSVTTLEPINWSNPYSKEIRAMVKYDKSEQRSSKYTFAVEVDYVDSTLTKDLVSIESDEYTSCGNYAVSIAADFATVCEDGYLSLHYLTTVGKTCSADDLVLAYDPADPTQLYLKCGTGSDDIDGFLFNNYASFRLDNVLPSTIEKGTKMTLHWKNRNPDTLEISDRTIQFKYIPRF